MAAVAWYARGHVVRPIRIFGALAVGGVLAAVGAFAGVAVPRAALAMCAALALAFSVNRRPLRKSRRPAARRFAWIAAAATMLAAIPTDVPPSGGMSAEIYVTSDLVAALIVFLLVIAVVVRIARGIAADREDRLLIGALGGTVVFAALWIDALPIHSAAWNYPWWTLLGAAHARAYGNIRRP
jgi:hypothetical protein